MTDTRPSETSAPAEGNIQAMPPVPPIRPDPALRSDLVESGRSFFELIRVLREQSQRDRATEGE